MNRLTILVTVLLLLGVAVIGAPFLARCTAQVDPTPTRPAATTLPATSTLARTPTATATGTALPTLTSTPTTRPTATRIIAKPSLTPTATTEPYPSPVFTLTCPDCLWGWDKDYLKDR